MGHLSLLHCVMWRRSFKLLISPIIYRLLSLKSYKLGLFAMPIHYDSHFKNGILGHSDVSLWCACIILWQKYTWYALFRTILGTSFANLVTNEYEQICTNKERKCRFNAVIYSKSHCAFVITSWWECFIFCLHLLWWPCAYENKSKSILYGHFL